MIGNRASDLPELKIAKLSDQEEPRAEPAVWNAMPAPQQNFANGLVRIDALLRLAWGWFIGKWNRRS